MEANTTRLRQKIDELEVKIAILNEAEMEVRDTLTRYCEQELVISSILNGVFHSSGKSVKPDSAPVACEKFKKVLEDYDRWSRLHEYMRKRFQSLTSHNGFPENEKNY